MNENDEQKLHGDIVDGEYSTDTTVANTEIHIDAPQPEKKKRGRIENLIGHQWKPGQSGNPKGRPKTPDQVRDMLKDALEDAVKTLIELSQHAEKDSVRDRKSVV